MIYIKLEGHDFRYEVEDIIRLYLGDEEIIYIEKMPPEDYRGIFVLSRIVMNENGELVAGSEIYADGRKWVGKYTGAIETECSSNDIDQYEYQKRLKREVKRAIYIAFTEFTGTKMPWGMLTGIRPAKIVHEMLEDGRNEAEIQGKLTTYYMIAENKASLLYDIAVTEKALLDKTQTGMVGVYIGIPFCTTRCLYCSFTSNPLDKNSALVESYLKALETEISCVSELIKDMELKVQSIYIGGGTPTSLGAEALSRLLAHIENKIDLSVLQEYTLEAGRPDTIDRNKLEVIKDSRVDRISINPQTMNDDTLKLIGRGHTAEDVVRTYNLAREIGFSNINMDVIVGLPGENKAMFENTMREIQKLKPDSLTVHSMAIKRASRLKENKELYDLNSAAEAAEMIEIAGIYAGITGLKPYYLYRQKNMVGNLENIGYSRPGLESIYNIQIMEEKQTIIALGAGAITKVVYKEENRLERAFNVKSVEEYINRVEEMVERKRKLLTCL